ncbi:MAG: DUF4136 domain-containing protein [Chitinophagaceae bacterium]|nr:DUF4136 domain-containing protein [Chitinophagaceae bacterium]
MKKMSFKHLMMPFAAALFLVGCGTTAHIEKADNVNFSDYKTFAWVKNDAEVKKNPVNDIAEQNLQGAVNKELAKSGWKESKNKPDVLLDYDILVEKNVKQQNNAVYSRPYSRLFYNPYTRRYGTIYYPSQFLGYENAERTVKEGTITVTMIDAKSDKTIWQGWATEEVNSRNLTGKEISSAVRSIFRKFDVAKN